MSHKHGNDANKAVKWVEISSYNNSKMKNAPVTEPSNSTFTGVSIMKVFLSIFFLCTHLGNHVLGVDSQKSNKLPPYYLDP